MSAFSQTESIISNFLILYCALNFVIKINSHNVAVHIMIFIYRLISSVCDCLDHDEGIHKQLIRWNITFVRKYLEDFSEHGLRPETCWN